MSKVLIHEYYNDLDCAIQFGKSTNEQAVRNYFWYLLNDYAGKHDYEVIPEVSHPQGHQKLKVEPSPR